MASIIAAMDLNSYHCVQFVLHICFCGLNYKMCVNLPYLYVLLCVFILKMGQRGYISSIGRQNVVKQSREGKVIFSFLKLFICHSETHIGLIHIVLHFLFFSFENLPCCS